MRGKYVIAGIGHTQFGRLPGRGTVSMNVEACRNALADAGIEKSAVDALFVKVPTSKYSSMYGQTLAEAMGMQPKVGGVWDQGGATNISMISFACMAIDAGQCEVAIVCLADDPKTGTRQAYEKAWGDDGAYGWFSVAAGYAMSMQRHKAEYGTKAEQFGEIAVAVRNHGANNPHAALRLPLTLDKYMESPFIIEPLKRDDICLVSDGAAAVVVMSEKRAKELGVKAPVKVLGFGQGQTSYDVPYRPVLTETMAKVSAQTAFKMAGLAPKDIDVAQIYDCYTIAVMMTLEDYGFCEKGEGGKWVEGGRVAKGGELPINTSGGLLSETGMPGLQLVMEGVRQMRGTSVNQVKDAATCIVSNQGGIMTTHSTMILGTEMSFPLPEPTPLSQPYWDSLRAGKLTFQRCRKCSHAWLPARAECPNCLAAEWAWTEASGKGRVISWVIYHHAYHEEFKKRVPYNVALVELDEGPRLITNIVNPDAGLKAERPVSLKIEDEHGAALARFALI